MTPLLLLVEDDPTSRDFLGAALRALPAVVECAGSAAQALACARTRRHDLWLIDAHLPDADGTRLLAQLRATGATTPALAHTAALDAALFEKLRGGGFADVIGKPIGAAVLQSCVRRHLCAGDAVAEATSSPVVDRDDAPVWDDTAALAALNGNGEHVVALRGLFVGELPAQHEAVLQAAQVGDLVSMQAQLHRLRASCGFTGAARLARATAVLADAVRDGLETSAMLAAFEAAVEATLDDAGRWGAGGG